MAIRASKRAGPALWRRVLKISPAARAMYTAKAGAVALPIAAALPALAPLAQHRSGRRRWRRLGVARVAGVILMAAPIRLSAHVAVAAGDVPLRAAIGHPVRLRPLSDTPAAIAAIRLPRQVE